MVKIFWFILFFLLRASTFATEVKENHSDELQKILHPEYFLSKQIDKVKNRGSRVFGLVLERYKLSLLDQIKKNYKGNFWETQDKVDEKKLFNGLIQKVLKK